MTCMDSKSLTISLEALGWPSMTTTKAKQYRLWKDIWFNKAKSLSKKHDLTWVSKRGRKST